MRVPCSAAWTWFARVCAARTRTWRQPTGPCAMLRPLLLLLWAQATLALTTSDKQSLYGRKKTDRLVQVTAVEGQPADLPCDVTTPGNGDSLRLVLWYYGTEGTIYTYDARGRSGASGSHWVSDQLDTGRLRFQAHSLPASLRIVAVNRSDSGVYRCRVDYLASPTQNSRVNLTVIVPPQKPVVLDAAGTRINDGRLGPYKVGQSANVTCAALNGYPPPNVTWWRGGSRLALGPLRRADHGARYTCIAAFHTFSAAVSTSVVVDMICRPAADNRPRYGHSDQRLIGWIWQPGAARFTRSSAS
ncbi:cell adhesion molecule 1-like [Pollicipes pollicipes]|uniref:cell adhesion molecule 1-like n=1 Tax=Pollicipes pollicipes TaxID=41117 RepID=UPI001884C7FC|nr:cell adhesion molecule 1-like [Pollicipes pollicipes]